MTERVPILTFHDGGKIPQLGLGTYGNSQEGVHQGLKIGYRHLDCASFYQNQDMVGRAIKSSQTPRQDLFITSKVWISDMSKEKAKESLNKTLKDLDTDYLDLLLIHWPIAQDVDPKDGETLKKIRIQVWKAFIQFKKKGLVRHIGVSNFLPKHIDQLIQATGQRPVVNQFINHPYLVLEDVIEYCQKKMILIEGWSPFAQKRHNILQDKSLNQIAQNHNKTVPQIIIRWNIQNGIIVFPKSEDKKRLKQNFTVFDFQLSNKEMQTINNIHKSVEKDREQLKNMLVQ